MGVEGVTEGGESFSIAARVVVDASGRDALMARTGPGDHSIGRIAHLDRTALFTQVRGAWRDTGQREGDIQIIVFGEGAERGWFWFIPFRDGRTSVGAVVSSAWIRARQATGGAAPPRCLRTVAVAESPDRRVDARRAPSASSRPAPPPTSAFASRLCGATAGSPSATRAASSIRSSRPARTSR